MDLHAYKDVAENYDLYLQSMYRVFDKHENFQEFYLDLARKYGQGGVVDIACGTGAVLLYLAERGISVDGTDLSEEMCKVASAKAEKRPPEVESNRISIFLWMAAWHSDCGKSFFLSESILIIGQTFSHNLQSIHKFWSTSGYQNPSISVLNDIAFLGQISPQALQPQQSILFCI